MRSERKFGMDEFNTCATQIAALAGSDKTYSAAEVDGLVDPFLVGFGTETGSMRMALAKAAYCISRPSALAERIYWRVLRDGPERPI
jgi:hypothetical protein